MSGDFSKGRFIRSIPGRVRIGVNGLTRNPKMATSITGHFTNREGILSVVPNINSGRVLIKYKQCISLHEIYSMILAIEEKTNTLMNGKKQIAASIEAVPGNDILNRGEGSLFTSPFKGTKIAGICKKAVNVSAVIKRLPLPLAISVGGLCFLGVKRLLVGKSLLATAPILFYASAGLSLIVGYTFLRKGFKKVVNNDKEMSDFILGSSILALSLLHENILMLLGFTLFQYVNWKLKRPLFSLGSINNKISSSPKIIRYSNRASIWGATLAGITLLLTGSPLTALAILFALNPGPVTIPNEFTWSHAEYMVEKNGYVLPENGSLSQLTQTNTIVFEDTSQLFQMENMGEISCIAANDHEEGKVWCTAASLLKDSNHPWKEEILSKAEETGLTIRTAFDVEEMDDGMKAMIKGSNIYSGDRKFLKEINVDLGQFSDEAEKWENDHFDTQYIVREDKCLGILVKKCNTLKSEFVNFKKTESGKDWKVKVLQNSLAIDHMQLKKHDIDVHWLSISDEELMKRVNHQKVLGNDVLVVAKTKSPIGLLCRDHSIQTISLEQCEDIDTLTAYANKVKKALRRHLKLDKVRNIISSILAFTSIFAAPIVLVMSDIFRISYTIDGLHVSKKMAPTKYPSTSARAEVAATYAMDMESQSIDWHTEAIDDISASFSTNLRKGLLKEQIKRLKKEYGSNVLQTQKRTPFIKTLLEQFKEFTTVVLLGASLLSLLTGGFIDGIAMGGILVINALIGAVQEQRAESVVQSLNQFQPPVCTVIRDEREVELCSRELVPGDIVSFEPGDIIPADIRIIQSWNLEVNEAALTGESFPVEKKAGVMPSDCPINEQNNMLFMGTDITRGKAIGIVVKTGMQTEIGHLMSLFKNEEREITPLQRKVTSIAKKFCKGVVVAGVLVFIAGLLRGIPMIEMITTTITLAASAVPQGLPIVITIALSAGIFRMVEKKALIRKLSSLETLGRTTVICTDKTGTLTKNEMTVKAIHTIGHSWEVTGNGYDPNGAILDGTGQMLTKAVDQPELEKIIQIGVLCNDSKLEKEEDHWIVRGDPTEGALLNLGKKAGKTRDELTNWTRYHEIPFDSSRGTMSVACREEEQNKDCYLFTKGSIEIILDRSGFYQENGNVYPLTDDVKQVILEQNREFAEKAFRVLAFAYRPMETEDDEVEENSLTYVGIVGMIDPPKPEIEESIQEAYELGVKPIMITGDHPITAIAIGKQLGIIKDPSQVITGRELDKLSDDKLAERARNTSIFARVTPEQKLRIVTAYQKLGDFVAMTGDGVNDSPAIKKADVGISMGITGTEVTKESADMVLKEDNFTSIIDGIKEGRTIIGNIRKAIGCLLTGNLAEILVTSVAVILGMPIPLVPIQILLMNLLTDAIPATILAVNPGSKRKLTKQQDIVDKPLYQKIVTRGVLLAIGVVGLFGFSLSIGTPLVVAQTMAFATLVAGQLVQTFSWRQEGSQESVGDWTKDGYFVTGLCISWLALALVIYTPPLAAIFHTAPLTLAQWIPVLLVAGSITILSKPMHTIFRRGKIKNTATQEQLLAV